MQDGEVKNKLSPAQISVMRHRVTEPPYFGKFWDHFDAGTYSCAACDTKLFDSSDKFDSKTGWPTFKKPINERDLQFKSVAGPDDKAEIRCRRCKSHLGYVIAGDTPYYRLNSVSLGFNPAIVAPIPAPVASDARPKKAPTTITETKGVSAHKSLAGIEIPPWNWQSLVGGIAVGIVLGALGAYLYARDVDAPPSETATSTPIVESLDGAGDPLPEDTTPPSEPVTIPDESAADTNAADPVSAPNTPTSTDIAASTTP